MQVFEASLNKPRPRLFSQGQGQDLRCQDLVIQCQGQDLHEVEVSSRIRDDREAKARPRGQQDWSVGTLYSWTVRCILLYAPSVRIVKK